MVTATIDPLLFWGKAAPRESEAVRFHPLAYHGLDVAAAFEALIEADPHLREALSTAFSARAEDVSAPLTILSALHDIGKVAKKFQAKCEEAWPSALGAFVGPGPAYDHAAGSSSLLIGRLKDTLAPLLRHADFDERRALLFPIAFHHGKPQDRHPNGTSSFDRGDEDNARMVAEAILSAFDMQSILPLPQISPAEIKGLSWRLSGLVSLADWIGSSTEFFPYRAPASSPRDYWLMFARPAAHDALRRLRLAPPTIARSPSLAALFGSDWTPSPGQSLAASIEFAAGPTLAFIEDVTGAGKTEAALLLAHRFLAADKGRGLFIALPTTATANAMYDRMKRQYRRLFSPDASPSLALAHGRSRLHEDFRASVLPNEGVAEEAAVDEIETVHAACSAFFADDRRKALLADVGVGTIDQALLGVLPTKYATLRQLGLAAKVLVIDEAHAYDAYMSREVERLLTFHAGAGGSAIILSATLPRRMKERYARAFRGGLHGCDIRLRREDYPLVTMAPLRGEPVETPLDTREDLKRRVQVTRLSSRDEALARMAAAAAEGAAVAYIRNSVDDAIEAWEALRATGLEPLLFHARFAMADRLAIEQKVLDLFGKQGEPEARKGRILVATPVVEQSLDLDFDLLASDLAPIDLLIQRAGRLWRHQRGARPIAGPELLVVSPEPAPTAGADWFEKAFPRASRVYGAHALLWLGAKTLFDAGAIVSPEGVRPMIEAVYGAGARDQIPEELRSNFDFCEGQAFGESAHADNNLLDFSLGYAPGHLGWSSDVRASTRLGEPHTVFRLAFWDGARLRPYARDEDIVRAWALSEVSVGARRATGRGLYAPAIEAAASALESRWREAGDGAIVLPLEGVEPWRASGSRGEARSGRTIDISCDSTSGLRLRSTT